METKTQIHGQDFISAVPEINRTEYKSKLFIPPTINNAFCKNEALDNTIVHRRLAHALDEKVDKMAKLNIILDLPKRKSKRYSKEKFRCVVCWKASTVNLPKGVTMNTDNLRPGELFHVDFCFLDETSIQKFTCALVVVDAKVRKCGYFALQANEPIGNS